ncbi:MAG: TolC family protein [Bacteroidales bacterium]|nr:TolC family protein [Bacteroidales bacterium]
MKRFATILAFLTALWTGATAQAPSWRLDSCIDYALSHNSSILLAEAQKRRSQIDLIQSKMRLLPTLQLYVNQYYNWGRSVDMQELVIVRNRLTRQTSASVGASFSIFDGFATLSTIAANRALAMSAVDEAAQTALEIKADISRAYLGNILARLTAERLSDSYDTILRQIEKVSTLVARGQRTTADLLELKAKAADISARIAEAESEEALQMQQLRKLTGREEPFSTDMAEYGSLPAMEIHQAGDYLPHIPAVAAAEHSVEAAEYSLKAARGALLPTLSLSAAYGTYYSDAADAVFKDQVSNNRNPSISLSLVVPILDCGKAAGDLARARNDLEKQRLRLKQITEESAYNLLQIKEQCILLESQQESLRVRQDYCAEKLRLADREYELGTISTAQWIEAGEDYAQSTCDHIQCRCKYLFQKIILNLYYNGCQKE